MISRGGIGSLPGMISKKFAMDSAHPLGSLAAMIAPSPDWFVGVTDLALFEGGHWRGEVVVELWPWDAGTDSRVNFTSSNADTNPQDPIELITGFPFEGDGPLGTFTVRLLCDNPPIGDINGDCRVDFGDFAVMAGNRLVELGGGTRRDGGQY